MSRRRQDRALTPLLGLGLALGGLLAALPAAPAGADEQAMAVPVISASFALVTPQRPARFERLSTEAASISMEAKPADEVLLVDLGRLEDGARCVKFDFADSGGDYVFNEQRVLKVNTARAVEASCDAAREPTEQLALRVYSHLSPEAMARYGLSSDSPVQIGFEWPPGTKERDIVDLSALRWTLRVDGLPLVTRTGSEMVEDPQRPGFPALLLVDRLWPSASDVAEPQAPSGQAPDTGSQAPSPVTAAPAKRSIDPRRFSFDASTHRDPVALYVGQRNAAVPTLVFSDGQTLRDVYLQPVPGASDPSAGRYCLRPVYDQLGKPRAFLPQGERRFAVGSSPPADHTGECGSNEQLEFLAYVRTGGTQRYPVRFVIDSASAVPLGAPSVPLDATRVRLRGIDSGNRDVLALATPDEQASGPGWFVDAGGVSALYLAPVQNFRGAPALTYAATGGGEPGQVLVDGERVLPQGSSLPIGNETRLQWPSGSAAPVSVSLCSDPACRDVFARLPTDEGAIVLRRNELLLDGGAWLAIDWAPATDAQEDLGTTALAAEPAAIPSASVAPVLRFGAYGRPLTSCLGRIIAADWQSDAFSLSRGEQAIDTAALAAALSPDTQVRIAFDRMRDQQPCPDGDLLSAPMQVVDLVAARGLAIDLPSQERLFAAYVQLNDKEYRSSLARWKNVLAFTDRLYASGRARGDWLDGLIYGAAERNGEARTLLEPVENFPASLGDAGTLREVANRERNRQRVSSSLFGEQVGSLADSLGDATATLFYYDDIVVDCSGYGEALAFAGATAEPVIVLAGIDGYVAGDGALEDELAYVCVDEPALRVYAFNRRERADNEDFERMLSTVFDDLDAYLAARPR